MRNNYWKTGTGAALPGFNRTNLPAGAHPLLCNITQSNPGERKYGEDRNGGMAWRPIAVEEIEEREKNKTRAGSAAHKSWL